MYIYLYIIELYYLKIRIYAAEKPGQRDWRSSGDMKKENK